MRFRSVFFHSLLAGLAVAAISCPAAAQASGQAGSAILTGQAVNATTGEPVPLAHVLLQGASPQMLKATIGDSSGHFTFRDVQPGQYLLSAERNEFMHGEYGSAGLGQPGKMLALQAGQTLDDLKLPLTPQGVITGSVVAEDGDPLPGIQVNAHRCESGSSSRVSRAFTDDLGQYRLHGLPPGHYCVSAAYRARRGTGSDDSSGGGGRGAVFYPHALSVADATVLEVAPGNVVTSINFSFTVGQPAARTQEGSSNGTTTIRGHVVNAATGEGVRNAEVELNSENADSDASIETLTDGSGNFTLSEVRQGDYRITASRAGFMFGEYGASGGSGRGKKVSVTAEQPLDDVNVGLVPQGVIAGKVLEGDTPLSDAIVIAVHASYVNGKHTYVLATRAYTDDLGGYRLSGLAPGHYYLSTTYRNGMTPGYVPQDEPSTSGVAWDDDYVTTYYPRALSLSEAVPVEVVPGSVQTAIDLPIFKIKKVRVSGRVSLPVGARLSGDIDVSLTPRDPGFVAKFSRMEASVDGSTGRFEIRAVPPGAYVLTADWTSGNTGYAARQPIEIGKSNVDGLNVVLSPDLRLDGRVSLAHPDKIDFAALHVSLQSAEEGPMGASGSGQVNANGAFSVENLRPGRYLVSLSGLSGDFYLKSVSVGGQDFTRSDLELVRGSAGLALVISATAGKINGTVLNDQQQPVNGATVALVPELRLRTHSELYKSTTTDSSGNFNLDGIAPGDYKIFAWEDIAPNSYQDPDVIALFERLGQSLSVSESSNQKIQVNVISSAGVR